MHPFSLLLTSCLATFVSAAAFGGLASTDSSGIASFASHYHHSLENSFFAQYEPRLPQNQLQPSPSRSENHIGSHQPTVKRSPTPVDPIDTRPTPDPTGDPSPSTSIHITGADDFSLILPNEPGQLIGDAEVDGVSFCSPHASSADCGNRFNEGFITAASVMKSDDDEFIQITGCINPLKSHLDPSDTGGQFDVRYPNGAQCSFGGYGASFIELIEPGTGRFCLRCCRSAGDQINCNSHRDRLGCLTAIPGTYDFPDLGVSCT